MLLNPLELRFDGIEDRKVAIHHRIHQCVKNVSGAPTQQFGLVLAARTHFAESLLDAGAHRQDIVAAHKNVDFADAQLAARLLDHVDHGEQRIAVFLDLWPLMAVTCVLHRQGRQVELRLHHPQGMFVGFE